MAFMFAFASHFNGELDWDVARVQQFHGMFQNADMFNAGGPTLWDVSGAVDKVPIDPDTDSYGFVSMFEGARDFNQDISHWDMRFALKLDFMFRVSPVSFAALLMATLYWSCSHSNVTSLLGCRMLTRLTKIYRRGTLIKSRK
jgi:Mycoplasma protein of unknown function, DUF285